jgi:gamma-glutamyltranspeptidase/glutathione hydrolase
MAFGTPGGDQQDQWGLLFLLRVIHGGLSLQDAIDGPAFHSEHFPSSFYPHASHPGRLVVEDRFEPATLRDLRHRGHEVYRTGPWSLGRLSAVVQHGGFLKAAANPRGAQGYAVGR